LYQAGKIREVTMSKIKGPGIFLAQFRGDEEPYNSLVSVGKWVADLGYETLRVTGRFLV
jgi:hypothetical protein